MVSFLIVLALVILFAAIAAKLLGFRIVELAVGSGDATRMVGEHVPRAEEIIEDPDPGSDPTFVPGAPDIPEPRFPFEREDE